MGQNNYDGVVSVITSQEECARNSLMSGNAFPRGGQDARSNNNNKKKMAKRPKTHSLRTSAKSDSRPGGEGQWTQRGEANKNPGNCSVRIEAKINYFGGLKKCGTLAQPGYLESVLRIFFLSSTRGPMERRPPPKREIVGSIPTVCVQHLF